MQDRKTAEAGKNPLGPIGGKKSWDFFLLVGEKKCRLEKSASGPGLTCDLGPLVETVTFVAVKPKVPGSNTAGTSI